MNRFFRSIALSLALTGFALGCAGCFSTAESRQAAQGKEKMEAYLRTRSDAKKASVVTATTDRVRPAPDQIDMPNGRRVKAAGKQTYAQFSPPSSGLYRASVSAVSRYFATPVAR